MLSAEIPGILGVTFLVLSCHSIEVQGSLPRFKNLTFRGHVLRHHDILLARAIAVSPWLGGPGCALPCFGFIGFRVSLCRVGCRIVGLSDVGLFWKWVSAAFGKVLDQA